MVLFISCYPGMRRDVWMESLDAGDVEAVIIEGYHSGTAHACANSCDADERPCPYDILPFLEHAKEKNVPVFLIFGYFVGDEDNSVGYEPFDDGKPGGYITSKRMIKAGVVPLKANWQQSDDVRKRVEEATSRNKDYESVARDVYRSFPFKSSLDKIRGSAEL